MEINKTVSVLVKGMAITSILPILIRIINVVKTVPSLTFWYLNRMQN